MTELLIIGMISTICGLIIAMVLEAKRQKRKMIKRVRIYIKDRNKTLRLSKWKRIATEWREELKRPVKVKFT
jgi:hypothetical protein